MLVTLLKPAKVCGYSDAIKDVRTRLMLSLNPTTFRVFEDNADELLDQIAWDFGIDLYGDGGIECEGGDQAEDTATKGMGDNVAEKE